MIAPTPTDLIALLHSRLGRKPFRRDPAKGSAPNLNLIGLRSLPGTPDRFDDLICALYETATDEWTVQVVKATTDPGLHWLRSPSRAAGTAILIHDRFYPAIWRIGKHKGEYPALVQNTARAAPPVWRDGDRDGALRYGGVEHTDAAGINLHHAGEASTVVDKWSAGCQVVAARADWDRLWSLIERGAAYGPTFSYALIGVP